MSKKTNNFRGKKRTENDVTLSSASVSQQQQKRVIEGGGMEWLGLEGKEVC